MTRLAERKTKLTAITNATARYRGRERAVVVEIFPETAVLRLLGTRTRKASASSSHAAPAVFGFRRKA